jgi:hypothetical protein
MAPKANRVAHNPNNIAIPNFKNITFISIPFFIYLENWALLHVYFG